jgi:methylglutaconyl-CoA hydratase
MVYPFISVEQDSRGVFTVTLNRPEKHNAFDDQIIYQLSHIFNEIAANPTARVMILAANGKSFSAGADLNWMKSMIEYSYERNLSDANALASMLKTLNDMPIPTIAKVQGGALGGAVGLVSCCDIAVATSSTYFCLSEVKIGLIPATIGPYVIQAIGQRAARRYFNTAERFDADTAAALGLISEVVDTERLDESVNQFVQQLLSNSPAAIKASKQLISEVAGKEIDKTLIDTPSERIANIRISTEGQQGLSAFLDKQPAPWLNA